VPNCHEVKHIGLASIRGRAELARSHLLRVNRWTPEQANAYLVEAFAVWERRIQAPW
jgi:hypothetical protein